MSLNIWFVPGNTNHIRKNIALLQRMREAGHDVRIICIDDFIDPIYSTLEQIKKLDFEYEKIPADSYRQDCPSTFNALRVTRSLYDAWQVRKLPTIFRTFLLDRRQRPDVLIFGSEVVSVDRSFIKTAQSLGIPSVLVADGIFLPENPGYHGGVFNRCREKCVLRISRVLRRTGTEGTSGVELVFVVNGTSKEHFVRNGMPADRIHVVCLPEYIELVNRLRGMKDNDYRAIRERAGILSNRPIVMFAHQPLIGQEELERMVLEMVEGCRRAGAILLVKFHPSSDEDPDIWRKWGEKQGINHNDVVFLRKECTSQDAVLICTAFITIFSTVLMEALTCRRPMLLIKFVNTERILSIGEQYGIALDVRNEKDLAGAVASIVADEGLRKRLLDNYPLAIQKELNGLDENVVDVMLEKIERFIETRH